MLRFEIELDRTLEKDLRFDGVLGRGSGVCGQCSGHADLIDQLDGARRVAQLQLGLGFDQTELLPGRDVGGRETLRVLRLLDELADAVFPFEALTLVDEFESRVSRVTRVIEETRVDAAFLPEARNGMTRHLIVLAAAV